MHQWERLSWFKLREQKKGRGKQIITSLEVKKMCSIQLLEAELTFNRICYHMTFGFGSVESSGAAGSKDVQYLWLLIEISSVHIIFLLDCFYWAPHHAPAQCCLQFWALLTVNWMCPTYVVCFIRKALNFLHRLHITTLAWLRYL